MGERTREWFILIAGDIIVFNVALWLTLLVRYFEWPDANRLAMHMSPFLIFTGAYVYSVYTNMGAVIIWNTGLLSLLAMALMMGRNDGANKILEALTELIKSKSKKD